MLIRNPLVWLRRIRHRRGYGIHSPFAYQLVTQVLYCPGRYYADEWLYPLGDRLLHPRRTAVRRLLFRLANHWQPAVISAPRSLHPFLHAGCRGARLVEQEGPTVTLEGAQGRMVALVDLQGHAPMWQQLRGDAATRVSFDLYDVGIAVCVPRLNKQHYMINW